MDGIICNQGQIGYRFIPKSACTSIKQMIFELEFEKSFQSFKKENPEKKLKSAHAFFNRRLNSIDGCPIKVIVIRDPIKRFLSAYGNRVHGHSELSKRHLKKKKKPIDLNAFPKFTPDLYTFIDHFDIYSTVKSIHHHCKPVSEFLDGQNLSYFTHVIPMEEVEKVGTLLNGHYGKNIPLPRSQTRGKKADVTELRVKDFDQLFEFYEKDYHLLKDYYTPESLLESIGMKKIKQSIF